MMKFGFIPTEGGHYYQECMDEILYAEELGFDSAWLEEHHSVKNHYWPSPLMALAGVATRTSRIMLGTDIIVLPFYHPVRIAEDVAMLDIMSAGRIILGVAIGYRSDEFALYQLPLEKRGAKFAEAIAFIRQLWTQESVTFQGVYYQADEVKIEPRPEKSPLIWLGGWGQLSLERAATLGDAWVPGPTAGLPQLLESQSAYRGCLEQNEKNMRSVPTPLTREVVIAATDEQAREMAEKHLLINYRDEYGGGWDHPLISKEESGAVNQLDVIGADRFIVGSPETCIKKIQRFVDTFGVDHLICRLYFPGMPHSFLMSELKLIAAEVMPVFR
jgi:alkanesulfonate monooxygenase SsuD/methylene tetrahydromethanopterin reductase-like flavin-dependent oxidoreductase (luciferase family)